jgi:DNA-binding response OmpR family regulator
VSFSNHAHGGCLSEGRVLPLTAIEYKLLSRLTQAAGCVLARKQLALQVFEREFDPAERALDVHIHHLRRTLGPHSWLLVTVRGTGYMLRSSDHTN